jgi:hypothetical protein
MRAGFWRNTDAVEKEQPEIPVSLGYSIDESASCDWTNTHFIAVLVQSDARA